jgi:hypothetical protein
MTTTPPAASSARLSAGKITLFSLVLFALALGLLEGGAQIYLRLAKGYAGGEFQQYQFDPYKNILLTQGWRDLRGVSHNAQGFRRQDDVKPDKEPNVLRVFLMGASTAYGLGGMWPHLQTEYAVLDDSTTIDAYLERILADSFPGKQVEVINAGIPSIWTHHHLIYLNQTILRYDPDVVLFLDGWNDHFHYDRSHEQFASYAQTEQASRIMGPPTLRSLLRMNAWWLFRKSAFAHVAGRAMQGVLPAIGRQSPPPMDVARAIDDAQWVFERNALRMIDRNALLLRHEGIPTLFLLQPILALERDRLDRMPVIERKLFDFNLEAERPGYESYIRQIVPIVSARVKETVGAHGASYLDLTQIYSSPVGQVFTDYAHLTPTGNRILAEFIAPEVARLARVRMSTQARDSTRMQ